MVFRCDFCVEPRLVQGDLNNLEIFIGMLLHPYVAMVSILVSLGLFMQTVMIRVPNLILFDRQCTTSY